MSVPVGENPGKGTLAVNLVREVLSLAQGLDGKYINFHPTAHFTRTSMCAQLDASQLCFLERIAASGHSYRMIKSFGEQLKSQPASAFSTRHAFASALAGHLEEHCRLVTELCRQRDTNGLFSLYVALGETSEKLQHLAGVCSKLANKPGSSSALALLNELYFVSIHGDAIIQRFNQKTFMIAAQPYFASIKDWILNKEDSHITVDSRDCHGFGDDTRASSNVTPTFLSASAQGLIFKLNCLCSTFSSLIQDDKLKWLKETLTEAFKVTLSDESHNCMFKYNLMLGSTLQCVYFRMNEHVRYELAQKGILQSLLGHIELFFNLSDDCIEKICKQLKPNQVNILLNILKEQNEQMPSWKEVTKQLTKLSSIANFGHKSTFNGHTPLVPIFFQEDELSWTLVDEECRKDYLDIFLTMFAFKSTRMILLDCWKDIMNFSKLASSSWNSEIADEVRPPLQRMALKVHQMVLSILARETQMHSAVRLQIDAFKQTFFQVEVLHLSQVHRQFLSDIQEEIKMTVQVQLDPILQMVPNLSKQVACFIKITKKTFKDHMETGWNHGNLKNVQLYKEELVKMGILEFITPMPFK